MYLYIFSEPPFNSLYLDLQFDDMSFDKYFSFIDHKNFKVKNEVIPLKSGEIIFNSLKMIDKEFIKEILEGLRVFESYLI